MSSEIVSILAEAGMNEKEKEYRRNRDSKTLSKSELVGKFLEERARQHNIEPRDIVSCYPSESMIHYHMDPTYDYTKLVGQCIRQGFFKRFAIPESDPDSIVGKRRMNMGVAIEKLEQEYIRKAGFARATNKKFVLFVPESRIAISGEIDLIIKQMPDASESLRQLDLPTTILEMKSFYGYNARKEIFGNKSQDGKPKAEHVLQLALYLDAVNSSSENVIWLKEILDDKGDFVRYEQDHDLDFKTRNGVIYYVDRGDCDTMEHNISITEDREILVNNKSATAEGFSFANIYGNYRVLAESIRDVRVPSKTAQYNYPINQTQFLIDNGMISASKAKLYASGKCAIGDWQCLYCNWKRACLGATPWEEDTMPEDEMVQGIIDAIITGRTNGED